MGGCIDKPIAPNPTPSPAPESEPAHEERTVLKFLLLGAGESGKSTLFKQMRINYVNDYSKDELCLEKEKILKAFIASFGTLVYSIREFSGNNTLGSTVLDSLADDFFGSSGENHTIKQPGALNEEVYRFMKAVWASDIAKSVWKDRSLYQLTDSLSYFCEHIDRIYGDDYMPTEEDYLRCRIVTVGILEQTFIHRGVTMIVVDVGGQRSERRKWVQAFDAVDAIFFVAALSEFNQQLFEDTTVARYDEALTLFNKTLNIKFFRETPFILFLNKEDLFQEKIEALITQNRNLDEYFPSLKLGYNYKNAADIIKEYVKSQFLQQDNKNRVFPHFVTATDKGAFELVFKSATSIVLREALNRHFDSKGN